MVRENIEPGINAIRTIVLVTSSALPCPADRLTRDRPLLTSAGLSPEFACTVIP